MIAEKLDERLRQEFIARFPLAEDDAVEMVSHWLRSQ